MVNQSQTNIESIKEGNNLTKSLKYCSVLDINSSAISHISFRERNLKSNSENLRNTNTFTSIKVGSSSKLREISSALIKEISPPSSENIEKLRLQRNIVYQLGCFLIFAYQIYFQFA